MYMRPANANAMLKTVIPLKVIISFKAISSVARAEGLV